MKIIDVVCGAIRNENGEILIAQRSEQMGHGGFWEFAGGKIEYGESPESALIREIKEELAIDILVGDMIGTFDHDYGDKIVRLHAFYAEAIQKPTALEHDDLMWISPLSYRGAFLLESNKPILSEIQLDSLF